MFNSSVPYTEIFELLSQFQKSKSENRELPLDIDKRLLSWFHAYDYHDYARHFSYYWAKQQELPSLIRHCMKKLLIVTSQSTEQLEHSTGYHQDRQQSRQSIKIKNQVTKVKSFSK